MPVTALYASLLAIIFIILSARVISMRRSERIGVGDGGNALLVRRMRVQANFSEYTPFALLLMVLAESVHTDRILMHILGIALLVARSVHAYGMSQPKEDFRFRVTGMVLTFAVIAFSALLCFFGALWHRAVI